MKKRNPLPIKGSGFFVFIRLFLKVLTPELNLVPAAVLGCVQGFVGMLYELDTFHLGFPDGDTYADRDRYKGDLAAFVVRYRGGFYGLTYFFCYGKSIPSWLIIFYVVLLTASIIFFLVKSAAASRR